MIHSWSSIEDWEHAVLVEIRETLDEAGAFPADIREDAALNEKIVKNSAKALIPMLRKTGATGAFLVLDGAAAEEPARESLRAGLYIRDPDPDNYSVNNADLLIERGPASISEEHLIPLGPHWNASFRFGSGTEEKDQFFFQPRNAALNSGDRDDGDFGYWSRAFSFSEAEPRIITYSLPLIADDGTVIGVLGVDITQSYLTSLLPFEELSADRSGGYLLAVTDPEKSTGETTVYQRIFSSGPVLSDHFGETDTVEGRAGDYDSIINLTSLKHPNTTVYGSVQKLQLYGANTPFKNQQWVLISVVESSRLLHFSRQIRTNAYYSVVLSLVIGVVGILIAVRFVTKPISELVKDLEQSNPNEPIRLRRMKMAEIDELTVSIESLSNAVAESSSRISKIITMAGIPVGVFQYQKNRELVFCSHSLFDILGWDDEGNSESRYLPSDEFKRRMFALKPFLYDRSTHIYRLSDRYGISRWVRITVLQEDGQTFGAVTDVTRDVIEKRKIEHERDYDTLTNLYNRRAFQKKLHSLFTERSRLKVAALIMYDLDNLKYVNDTYGHDCGDWYIQTFSRVLEEFHAYRSVVARRSGDEFYVLLYGYESKEEIRRILHTVSEKVNASSLTLPDNNKIKIRVSGGIAWYPDDTDSFEELIRYADFAMYSAKHTEKGAVGEFSREKYLTDSFLLSGPEALNRLIEDQRVRFAFQPILAVETGEIYGYEMLMRPLSKELHSPLEVLRLASIQSKLYPIERLTWFQALSAYDALIRRGALNGTEAIFINSIANQHLNQDDQKELEALYSPYLDRVVIEITESEPMSESSAQEKMQMARRWNAKIAMDDFGSGYSGESALIYLAPDIIKVDYSIVHGINEDKSRQNILGNLISYARKQKIRVLAEGVEIREEAEILIRYGVDYLQGYYIGRPDLEPRAIGSDILREIRNIRQQRPNSSPKPDDGEEL